MHRPGKSPQKGKKSISVIIVTYNNLPEIGACLQALAAALHGYSSSVTVIDNHSQDGTRAWLRDKACLFASSFDDLSVIYNDANLGFTKAVNQGLRQSTGDYCLFLNPDVIIHKDTIATLLEWFSQHSRVGVIAPQLRFADGRIQPSCRRFPRKVDVFFEMLPPKWLSVLGIKAWKMYDFDHSFTREVDQPQGAFLLVKKETLQDVGAWDERFFMFFSDVDWCRRARERGWQIWFVADTFVVHKKGASIARVRPAMLAASHRAFIQYFKKYDRAHWQKMGTNMLHILLLVTLGVRLLVYFLGQSCSAPHHLRG